MAMTSIRHQFSVAILLTTIIALLVSSLALTLYNVERHKDELLAALSARASLLGKTSLDAVERGDTQAVSHFLKLLIQLPNIEAAAIYNADGQLFASTEADDISAAVPSQANSESIGVYGNYITISRPITRADQLIGTAYIQAHYPLYKNLLGHLGIALMACALALTIAVLVSLKLQRSVTRPILQITSLARRVVETQDYSLRAQKTTSDEIGYLADALNEMLFAVEQRNQALTQANEQLKAQIKEREATEQSLRLSEQRVLQLNAVLEQRVEQRTSQLKHANQELEAFSYSVSHDLKTPLRAIDGFSQALLEDYSNQLDKTGLDYLHRVRKGARRMGQLITDLLKLARVSRGEIQLQNVDLSALTATIFAELMEAEPERNVKIQIKPKIFARCDPRLIKIALQNLIDNAWKYSSRQSLAVIEFGYQSSNDKPVYFIKDNGAGFDMAHADKLFGAFQRMHDADEFPGTGVGLATVQRIIHRHGGHIWAESEVNHGATFYFTLPESDGR